MSSPSSPVVARARPDRGATPAIAGFLCSLVSFGASLAAMVLAGYQVPFGNTPLLWRLVPVLQWLHDVLVPDTTSGEAMLLFTAAFPVALVGFGLSLLGRHSSSQRWLAISGMLLSSIVVLCFIVIVVILYIGWSQAFRYGALPGYLGV